MRPKPATWAAPLVDVPPAFHRTRRCGVRSQKPTPKGVLTSRRTLHIIDVWIAAPWIGDPWIGDPWTRDSTS